MGLFDQERKKYEHLPEYDSEYIDMMNEQMGMEFDVLEAMTCPKCGKTISDVFGIEADKPFTAKSPLDGLTVWGAYDVPKQIICQGNTWVHFKFLYDDSERLVLMRSRKKVTRFVQR